MAVPLLLTASSNLTMSLPNHLLTISLIFATWKAVILLIVWLAPGEGYDTSTTLLVGANKLVRWDAIYFVSKAQRGEVFEQEWAFGKGVSTLLSSIAGNDLNSITTTGALVSHVAHYVSVILLGKIAGMVSRGDRKDVHTQAVPHIAACLHIVSPAGVFLSVPYAEAPFSCLNMLGFWLYLQAKTNAKSSVMHRSCVLIMSGMSFGGAAMMRSNGILSGLPFAFDAFEVSLELYSDLRRGVPNSSQALIFAATVIAGLSIAVGLALPQYLAYQEYCVSGGDIRPWCYYRLPLIYSFVQSHYWFVCPHHLALEVLTAVGE